MSNITILQDQENFDFTLQVISAKPEISELPKALFIYKHGHPNELSHLKLTQPETCTVELKFINGDEHYGTHKVNLTYSTHEYFSQSIMSLETAYVILKFESQTLDTSNLIYDLQSNFIYRVQEELFFYYLDISDN